MGVFMTGNYLAVLADNQLFILSLAVITGILLGGIKIRGIKLGSSAALFTGLVFGWMGASISEDFFTWNLLFFVTAVGLISSKDIAGVLKRYGMKFVVLAVAVTGAGAAATLGIALMFTDTMHPLLIGGTFTGALTSSPGLGAALEAAGGNALITIGYTIAYPFGVLAVVIFIQVMPVLMKVDLAKERTRFFETLGRRENQSESDQSAPFTLISFVICMAGGVLIGSITVPIPWLGSFSLGSTGGALLFALFLGARGKLGPFPMRMDIHVLSAIRSISLAFFLAVMGILAGPDIPEILMQHGAVLAGIGIVSSSASLAAGLLLGRYVFKMNWVLLAGAITGAMTSTPGLGVAVESTGGDECSTGYGATYPAAIFCMVLFTKLIMAVLTQL